jgi:uncharacterized protein
VLDQQQIIQYRIQKAWETYNAAKVLIDTKYYSSALNRIYYACFYMVLALILTKDLSSSKHSGVKSLFNKHFVNLGCVNQKWGSFYSNLFINRQDVDYEDLNIITAEFVALRLKQAGDFLKDLETYINQKP